MIGSQTIEIDRDGGRIQLVDSGHGVPFTGVSQCGLKWLGN
jgi:hypothetical protein